MKKIITLFAITLLIGCSSSENEINSDPIVGTWKYYQTLKNDILDDNTTPCQKEYTLIFDNTNFKQLDYTSLNGGCVINNTLEGTWLKTGNNEYTITAGTTTEVSEIFFEGDNLFYTRSTGTDSNGSYIAKEFYIKQ